MKDQLPNCRQAEDCWGNLDFLNTWAELQADRLHPMMQLFMKKSHNQVMRA